MSRLLTAYVTHLPAEAVEAGLRHLESVAPEAPVVICHGGRRDDFEQLDRPNKVFVEDGDLRAPPTTIQSYNELLRRVWEHGVRDDPAIDAVLVLEYDQVVLRPGFEEAVLGLLDDSGADFLGKSCSDRAGTNWPHYLKYRDDEGLQAFLRDVSVRDDPRRIFGALGTGLIMRREVLDAFAAMEHYRPVYNELYLPTLAHHLGFRVDDVSRLGSLYAHVRWHPPYLAHEAQAIQASGAMFVHPLKDLGALPALTRAALASRGRATQGSPA